MAACEICGRPTTSRFGVCASGTPECRREYKRREYAANPEPAKTRARRWEKANPERRRQNYRLRHEPDNRRCELCGGPCRNALGVCQQNPACKLGYARRWRAANPERAKASRDRGNAKYRDTHLEIIRERARESSRRRYAADPASHNERDRKRYAANPERARARSREYREANPGKAQEAKRRWAAANKEAARAWQREYLQRTDRPCRYARTGCTEPALRGVRTCREHRNADAARYAQRKRDNTKHKLVVMQNGLCPWCSKPLPADIAQVHADHIIPVACGGPDVDWNLQALHGACNMSKQDKITPFALALAAAHGIILTSGVRPSAAS